MDVFDLDRRVVGEYSDFARSFTKMRSADIQARIDEQYSSDQFWPEPVLQLNPHFQVGGLGKRSCGLVASSTPTRRGFSGSRALRTGSLDRRSISIGIRLRQFSVLPRVPATS